MSESASQNGAPQKRARARKSTAKKTSAPEPAAAQAKAKADASATDTGPIRLTAIDRRAMIATAAYYRAERRGFQSGHELEDWLDAEADIETLLRAQLAGMGRSAGTA